MTRRDKIRDMAEKVREHIENAKAGYDVADQQFIIKYRNGEVVYIDGYNIPNKLCLNLSKITYMVIQDACDSFDTEGKSWFEDFAAGHWDDTKGFVFDPDQTPDSLEQWDMYISDMLEK